MWLTGAARSGKSIKGVSGRRVVIEYRRATKKSKEAWKTFVTTTMTSSGDYRVHVRPAGAYEYRARVMATTKAAGATSPGIKVDRKSGRRSLEGRIKALGSRLGKAQGKPKSLRASARRASRVPGLQSAASQNFEQGMLVRVRTKSAMGTWLVQGKIRASYSAAGGPSGRLGLPRGDAKCSLLEGGCVQQFSRGTLYSNANLAKASSSATTGRRGEVIATARSQVGYYQKYSNPFVQYTKFNRWMGSTRPWCGFLQSWSFAASGNGTLVPKVDSFSKLLRAVRAGTQTGHTPKVGALVFFNTHNVPGVKTHVGLVTAVNGGTIRVIDGNTVGGLPSSSRGVLERNWRTSQALLYAYPAY